MSKSVADLELSVRSRKALQRLNIATVGELASRTEAELLGCKNFGQTSLNEIKQQLGSFGLGLRKLED
jgi:DNA-directed RNA polymerase subunit alpha